MEDGTRMGRFIVLRDAEGRLHALSAMAVAAVCADDNEGSVLLLPGGRLVRVERPVEVVVAWLVADVSR